MDETTIVTQFTSSAAIVWAIQELKKAGWCRFIDVNTVKLNRVVSAMAALASGAAIHWNWDAATSTITISGLTAAAVASFLWSAAQQFIGQEIIYQAVYAPKAAIQATTSDVTEHIDTAARNVAATQEKAAAKVVEAVKENTP